MKTNGSHWVSEFNSGYRRGLVLGLTMAEIGILIIFVLLLLIGINELDRIKQAKTIIGKEIVDRRILSDLRRADSTLVALKDELGFPKETNQDEITRLIRALQEITASPEGQSTLQAVLAAQKEMRQIKNEIAKQRGADIADQVSKLADQKSNLQGQLTLAESKLAKAGLGKGERPCWVREDGTIDYLYDVVLESNGIRMREYKYGHRERERSRLPIPNIDPSKTMTQGEFLQTTEPLYKSSLAENCRFFVVVYDATGPTEKERYKNLLRTVEGHFYKRLDRGPAPF